MKMILLKLKQFFKWILSQLKDRRNLIIFAIVLAIVSCEVWVPYLLGIITGDAHWFAIGSICWAFWLAPFTPFLSLCIAITLAIRKLLDKLNERRKK